MAKLCLVDFIEYVLQVSIFIQMEVDKGRGAVLDETYADAASRDANVFEHIL